MVRVYNGKVEEPNDEKRTFFEDFLKAKPKETSATQFETHNVVQNDLSNILLYVSTGVLVGIAALFLLYRYTRKNKFSLTTSYCVIAEA